MPQAPAYAAAKAGLINFARSVAPRLAKRGIRVCAVCPQTVDTPMASLPHFLLIQILPCKESHPFIWR